jgi:hypothetical protein
MRRLPVTDFGTDVQGIRLYGDKNRQLEPSEVRVAFPGGDVTVARTTTGDYWVHVRVDTEQDVAGETADVAARITDARLDIAGLSTIEADTGDFDNLNLYHLSVRVTAQGSN